MKKIFGLLIVSSSLLLGSFAPMQKSAIAEDTSSCNNATIKGSYGTKFTGTYETGALAVVGLVQLDGKGNFQGIDTLTSDGSVTPNRIVSGTYSVRQDCTVQIVFTANGTAFLSGAIVDGGKEIFLTQTNPRSVITGTWKKVN